MKRICIDARMWGVKHTGIGRYVENLIDNLPEDPTVEVVLIVSPETESEDKLSKYKKYVAKKYFYSLASLFEMGWLLLKIRPDVLHVPHINAPFFWPGKMIVTVHDLIKNYSVGKETSTHNTFGYWIKQMEYLCMVSAVLWRADKIITPTNYWKNKLIEKHHVDATKIEVTYEGIDDQFLNQKSSDHQMPFKGDYLLYVGNLYPHKNVGILVEAVEKLKINLAIVCARSVFEKRLPKSQYVHYLGSLSDAQLISVYQNAQAFVFPSLIEGFGLPGLEAMASKCPVIAANASCLPEVYADAALYFEPKDVDDLVSKINLVMSDASLRKSLISKGTQLIKKYSWVKMAASTWQIYQSELH